MLHQQSRHLVGHKKLIHIHVHILHINCTNTCTYNCDSTVVKTSVEVQFSTAWWYNRSTQSAVVERCGAAAACRRASATMHAQARRAGNICTELPTGQCRLKAGRQKSKSQIAKWRRARVEPCLLNFFFAARAREFQEHTRLCLLLYQAKSNLRVTQQKTRFAQSGLCAGKWHTWSKYITLATVSE